MEKNKGEFNNIELTSEQTIQNKVESHTTFKYPFNG